MGKHHDDDEKDINYTYANRISNLKFLFRVFSSRNPLESVVEARVLVSHIFVYSFILISIFLHSFSFPFPHQNRSLLLSFISRDNHEAYWPSSTYHLQPINQTITKKFGPSKTEWHSHTCRVSLHRRREKRMWTRKCYAKKNRPSFCWVWSRHKTR